MAKPAIIMKRLAFWLNQPVTVLGAAGVALTLGASGWPAVQSLRPIGDLYVSLLQMVVLPFLLATIPLAMRSAMAGATNATLIRSLLVWIGAAIVTIAAVGALVPLIAFHFLPFDQATIEAMGSIVGGSYGQADLEFSLDNNALTLLGAAGQTGVGSLFPSNIFSALSADDTMR